ncbi:hypothetical protein GYMLUDRAFT_224459 [Collybiopsis luxurians FD-317 M1]|uniref:Dynamin GTPase n=1 Tax=Collybiopsis luxurians FD-317 M1 TaxID=944289 RepID=A0A0D0CR29_9AGAR|nr:hypothetical protein GYMLUDRAFT_224459 [Collybiopsis luxurians FD-317 M1]
MFQGARKLVRRGTTNVSVDSDDFVQPTVPGENETLPKGSVAGNSSSNNDDVSTSDYAKRCKALMELYRALRSLGAEMFFDLPKIAVIGAQSAGKSSLIEAVSGISVPRDSGICTRCPVELSMSSFVDEWKCSISLRIEYDRSGNQQGNSTTIPFCTLSSNEKPSVDLWLRRAQASVLYRERPTSDFQNMSLEELKRLKPGEGSMLSFSMNVIEVRLEDPGSTDLTFVDLPGLIQNAPDQEIILAQNLVGKNIEGSKTLILVTIPMSDEMENQEAARLARQTDPSGDRTIGVLTKPDTIMPGAIGSRQRWKDVLQGKIHVLRHGYYCVRLADDDERSKKLSRAESEERSTDFFANKEPWSNFEDRSRFGVPNFVKDISQLLLAMIETNLPHLKVGVDQLISRYSDELRTMPNLPTREASTEILLRISNFCRELHDAVMGKDHKSLAQRNRSHYAVFKTSIDRTNPDFWPFPSKSGYRSPGLHTGGGNVGPFDLQDIRKEITDATGWELPGIIPFDAIKNIVLKSTSTWRSSAIKCFDSVFNSITSAVEKLISLHFKQFTKLETLIKTLCYSKLDECKREALGFIEKLLEHESEPLYTQNRAYKTEKREWVQKYTGVHRDSSRYRVSSWDAPSHIVLPSPVPVPRSPSPPSFMARPPSPPSRKARPRLPSSKKARPPSPPSFMARPPSPPSFTARPPSPPSGMAHTPSPASSIARTPSPVPSTYDDEILVMATVSAYFHVASKRFVDHIPLGIEHQLSQFFAKNIEQALIENVMSGPDVAGRMKDLLSEDEDIANKRQFLQQRLVRLKEIREKLFQFNSISSS